MGKQVTRAQARKHECPECGAAPGERCVGVRGKPRQSVHLERMQVADPREQRRRRGQEALERLAARHGVIDGEAVEVRS